MVQDTFGCVPVDVLDDSGPPFADQYMPACMQLEWRNIWGFDGSFPADCTQCQQSDGGGMVHYANYLMQKHPKMKIALVSSTQDEVIRLFFSPGLDNCVNYNTATAGGIVLLQSNALDYMPAATFTSGLTDLRSTYQSTGRFATYFLGNSNATYHQHTWRARFYDPSAGTETIAAFVTNFLNGTVETIGP
jgi:hypothetical protein